MRRVGLCGLLAALVIASAALPASGATWHIYADGSGDAPTITAAVTLAASGDSVLVYAGTYAEWDIEVTKQLYIVGVAGPESTIINAGYYGRCFIFRTFTSSHILVQGFTLKNGGSLGALILSGSGGAVLCSGSSKVRLIDCVFDDNLANLGGAVCVRETSTVTIRRCVFYRNDAWTDYYPGAGGAIYLTASYEMLNAAIDTCIFSQNDASSDGGAIYITSCDASIRGCTFYQNYSHPSGASIALMDAGIELNNSIVTLSNGIGIVAYHSLPGASFSCNDFYGNGGGNYGGLISDQTGTNGNISADPLFCGAPNDLSISTISPCAPAHSPCGELIGRHGPSCDKGPNLVITSVIWSSATPQPGTNVTGTVRVKNAGTMNAGPFYVDYYENRATAPPEGLHGDERHSVASLAAGDSASWTTSPVTSAIFAEWQSYFRVDTDAQVLELNENDNLSGPHTIAWQVPNESGWPAVTGNAFHSSPVIASLDDDITDLEVAIGCDNGKLYVWRHDGTNASGFPVTLDGAVKSSPAVGNVYGDYRNEIIVGCDDGRLYCFDSHGDVLWRYSIGETVRTTPALTDLDGDGRLEIICASGSKIYALDGRGEPLKGWPYVEEVTFKGVAVGDVDWDGSPEIAATARVNESVSKVYFFEANGELHSAAWPVQLDAAIEAGPAIGNIEMFPIRRNEIVVGATSGRVYMLRTDGTVWSPVPQVTGSIESAPIIEDVDGDGYLDVVVTSRIFTLGETPPEMRWNGYVTAINGSGSIVSGWPQAAGFWPSDVGPVPSAVALGNNADVMAGSPYNQIFSWYGSGARTPGFPIYFGANVITSAAAGDVDGDGWIELFVATSGGQIHCRELRSPEYTNNDLWWPMYGHDRARTHCYGFEVPTAVEEDLAATPKATALASIYPNPFNPLTKIAFDLASKEHVELAIYDVSGRAVAVLVDRELGAGRHEAFWNGKMAGGTTAASGVYFCTLRAGNMSETKKLVLLR